MPGMEYTHSYPSPLGPILLVSDGEALTGLWFEDRGDPALPLSRERVEKSLPVFERTEEWLGTYFSGMEPGFTPPLRMAGTDFQLAVWNLLLQIPYGETTAYGELARRIAAQRGISRMSAQAVGGAVGRNPIPIIVPCHRVIGSNGSLIGYGGGIDRKVKLLAMERAACDRHSRP